jgi:hypothetical protein
MTAARSSGGKSKNLKVSSSRRATSCLTTSKMLNGGVRLPTRAVGEYGKDL